LFGRPSQTDVYTHGQYDGASLHGTFGIANKRDTDTTWYELFVTALQVVDLSCASAVVFVAYSVFGSSVRLAAFSGALGTLLLLSVFLRFFIKVDPLALFLLTLAGAATVILEVCISDQPGFDSVDASSEFESDSTLYTLYASITVLQVVRWVAAALYADTKELDQDNEIFLVRAATFFPA